MSRFETISWAAPVALLLAAQVTSIAVQAPKDVGVGLGLPPNELRSDAGQSTSVRFEVIATLQFDETAFAYARISPDGRFLAYTTEPKGLSSWISRAVRVIDVRSGSIEFERAGVDAFWSPDGSKLIYMSQDDPNAPDVAIVDWQSRRVTHDIAPTSLGDYFSWGRSNGADVIVTVKGQYFQLVDNRALLPARRILPCDDLKGPGDRPLISKDGRRATVFVHGTIVVRNLRDCSQIFATGIQGAKADFSYDGRRIAFHRPKPDVPKEFEIAIIDISSRTIATLTLPGSSYYPNWTLGGELAFRYETDTWNGFVIASRLSAISASPLFSRATGAAAEHEDVTWAEVFASEHPIRASRWRVVVVWAPWNAHSAFALKEAAIAQDKWRSAGFDVSVFESVVSGPHSAAHIGTLPAVRIRDSAWPKTWSNAQIPVTLFFENGALVTRLLGAQTADALIETVAKHTTCHENRTRRIGHNCSK